MIDHFSSQTTDAVASDNAPKSEALTIAIIGGGLTGLFTATLLERALLELERAVGNKQNKDATIQLTIFEKSRSVGRLLRAIVLTVSPKKTGSGALAHSFLPQKQSALPRLSHLG